MITRSTAARRCLQAGAAVLLLAPLLSAPAAQPAASAQSEVVLARNPRAISERNVCDPAETARLLDHALAALTGAPAPAKAWKALGVTATDVVAVKVNCNNWTITLSPKPELVQALCASLETVIPANQIIVYDNDEAAMKESGFVPNRSAKGVRFTGTDRWSDGFDPAERLTRIVTRSATKVINLASLKCVDENDLVVSLLLKNHIGSLVPEDMVKCHNDHDFLAGVCARASLRNKTVLNIITGLRGTYRRGVPWYWAGLIMGRDPLAVETAAIAVINKKRKQEGIPALGIPAYLSIAMNKFRLGTCDPGRIKWVRLEI